MTMAGNAMPMREAPKARQVKILCLLVGSILIVGSLALAHLTYSERKDAVEATINEEQTACEVSWKQDRKTYPSRVMPCANAVDFADKITGALITEGKSVSLTFRDNNGRIQNQTAFLDSQWLGEKTRSGKIPIVFRPGTASPIRKPPNLKDFWPMAMLASFGFLWIAVGFYRARVEQRNYEERVATPSPEATSPNDQKKRPGKIAGFIALLVAVAALRNRWTGHFSVAGFALGLVLVIIIYGWSVWTITKAMKAHDVAEAQQQRTRRSLILMGVACLIFVPTLLAFASF